MRAIRYVFALGIALTTAPALAAERAHTDYMVHCQGCHLPDGSGFPARGVPDMREVLIPFAQTEEGRAYLVQVPGARLSALPDDRLAAVTNWILENLAMGEGTAQPYTAEEVARFRAMPLDDAAATRTHLIEAIAVSADPE
jgi:mono/diheme cytochrome c family protein